MKSTIFKRVAALLLALVMCLTAFPGFGITAHAATDVTDEIFMIAFPREGDSAYDDDWGHGALSFKNGWHTAKSRYTNIRAISSYSSQICYCIEPGVSQNTGDEFKQKGENFWDNYPSGYNDVLSPDEIKLFIGRIFQYGYTGNTADDVRRFYGKEGAEIIVDNTQLTIFGGFAPNSSSAEVLSKALGSRTVMSGSVSRGKDNPSESLQMMERPLLTPDELKSLPKGSFVVMKTGVHPMQVKLKLFFEWGIQFDEDNPCTVPEHGNRKVEYAEKKDIMDGIVAKYHPDWLEEPMPADESSFSGGQDHVPAELHEPQQYAPRTPDKRRARGIVNPAPVGRKTPLPRKPEVKSDGQV